MSTGLLAPGSWLRAPRWHDFHLPPIVMVEIVQRHSILLYMVYTIFLFPSAESKAVHYHYHYVGKQAPAHISGEIKKIL